MQFTSLSLMVIKQRNRSEFATAILLKLFIAKIISFKKDMLNDIYTHPKEHYETYLVQATK